MDDFLIRTLRHAGFKVKFVQNVTDVGHLASDADTGEDKMEKGAAKYQTTVWDLAKKFENHFYTSLDKLNNLRPDNICRIFPGNFYFCRTEKFKSNARFKSI